MELLSALLQPVAAKGRKIGFCSINSKTNDHFLFCADGKLYAHVYLRNGTWYIFRTKTLTRKKVKNFTTACFVLGREVLCTE
jgi:hypothetical protein